VTLRNIIMVMIGSRRVTKALVGAFVEWRDCVGGRIETCQLPTPPTTRDGGGGHGTAPDRAGNPVICQQSTRRMVTLPGEPTYADTLGRPVAAQRVRQIFVAERDGPLPLRI